MWNFSNGACLKVMKTKSKAEITGLICTEGSDKRQVVIAGWDRKVGKIEPADAYPPEQWWY